MGNNARRVELLADRGELFQRHAKAPLPGILAELRIGTEAAATFLFLFAAFLFACNGGWRLRRTRTGRPIAGSASGCFHVLRKYFAFANAAFNHGFNGFIERHLPEAIGLNPDANAVDFGIDGSKSRA